MQPITLTIEKSKNKLWGRIIYEDNLIIDVATTTHQLEKRMKKLITDFHGVDTKDTVFYIRYDVQLKRIFPKRTRGQRNSFRHALL